MAERVVHKYNELNNAYISFLRGFLYYNLNLAGIVGY